jgi:hypothetical protein
MLIGGFEFPDKCPKDCPGHQESPHQGGFCFRCPIFNCTGDEFRMIEPEHYRPDWAEAWYHWFADGMKYLPNLYILSKEERDEG